MNQLIMKNFFLKTIFAGLLFLPAQFGHSQMLMDAPVFKGKVKSVLTTTTQTDTSKLSNVQTEGASFNEKGQYTEIWNKNVDRQIDSKIVYTRDENGNVIKSTSYSFGKATGKAAFKYDQNNNLTQSKDSYGSKYVYEYNEKNQCIKEDEYEGKIKYTTTYTYNDKGLCSEQIWSDAVGGTKILTETFKYNDAGKVTEFKCDWAVDDTLEAQDYTITKMYNAKNQLFVSTQTNGAGVTTSSAMFRYDDKGNETEMLIISVDIRTKITKEEKISYTYEYDTTGNWIKKTSFAEGVVDYTEERVITYY